MRNRNIKIAGYAKEIYIQFFDMQLIASEFGADKKWLLLFNPTQDIATIDVGMPDWYAKVAILAEAIAFNKVQKADLVQFYETAESSRIAAEMYCLTKVTKQRKAWLLARRKFYKFKLEDHRNEAEHKEYAKAAEFIERLIESDDDAIVEYLKCCNNTYETRYYLTDFADKVPDDRHIWLVYYTCDGRVFLDENSPEWYRKIASLAEEISMGGKYPELLEGCEIPDKDHINAEVERIIVDNFTPYHQIDYIDARIDMFKLIIEKELNTSNDMKNALKYLKKRRREM